MAHRVFPYGHQRVGQFARDRRCFHAANGCSSAAAHWLEPATSCLSPTTAIRQSTVPAAAYV